MRNRRTLRFVDANDKWSIIVLENMKKTIRLDMEKLLRSTEALYADTLREVDSSKEKMRYCARHYSFYNRL